MRSRRLPCAVASGSHFAAGRPRNVAGNGGTMAEVLDETLKPKEEKTIHGTRQIAGHTPQWAPRKRTGTERPEAPSQEAADNSANSIADQHPGNDAAAETGDGTRPQTGIERLIGEVDRALGKECEVLAQRLAAKAKKGSESALKLLVMLAERKKPRELPVKKPKGRAYSQVLLADPPWEGDNNPQQAAEGPASGEQAAIG